MPKILQTEIDAPISPPSTSDSSSLEIDRESLDYDDSEDLESTISKLRQLLSDKTVVEEGSSSDSFKSLEGIDAIVDGRLFFNIQIPRIEISPDLIFEVHYDGIYMEPGNPSVVGKEGQGYKYSIERRIIKKSLAEFKTLQNHFEHKPDYQGESPENARVYWQSWLQDICGDKAALKDQKLRQFLNYSTDGLIGVARKGSYLEQPKIDKVSQSILQVIFNSKIGQIAEFLATLSLFKL